MCEEFLIYLIYSLGNLNSYSINYYLFKSFRKFAVDEENNQIHKKFMKSIYKKIIFIITAIALFSVIIGVVKYSLTYIEKNPEKYLPSQK